MRLTGALLLISLASSVDGFTSHGPMPAAGRKAVRVSAPLLGEAAAFSATASSVTSGGPSSSPSSNEDAVASASTAALSPKEKKQKERKELIRKEGGRFAFNTKYGALNPYGIYYGLTAIALGIPWFFALTACQFLYFVTRNRVDKFKAIPTFFSHIWGICLLRLTRNYPKIQNLDGLHDFYEQNRAAMFVANHNSWMDIPFIGAVIGWRNYKLISKKELEKVPILGRAIKVAGHVMLDRTSHRSQVRTLKKGIQCLKDGVHLVTFPEGTRTRNGKLGKFKKGAFKMAHKAGAPVIPVSIVGAGKVMPPYWMFPIKPARNVASVIVHEPVESVGKTEQELADAVREAMISGLPADQRPDGE